MEDCMNKDIFVESYELPIDQPIVSSNSEHGYLLSGVQTNKKAIGIGEI